MVEDEKVRPPIYLNVSEFDQNGKLNLEFSEELYPIGNITHININITNYLILTYTCMGDSEESEIIPKLLSYQILNTSANSLILKLNYSDPLYVSSFSLRDRLSILVIANQLFTSNVDGVMVE